MSRFALTPQVRFNRSKFDLSKGVKTSMSVGKLYPIDIQEVLPGDTFKNKTICVARVTSSFLKPVMDNCYLDIYHFFIPYRLLFKDMERVFGNPNPSAYIDNNLAEFPKFGSSQVVSSCSVADYLGLPVGNIPGDISVLPFRAFAKVYDQWFRNQNTCQEIFVQDGEKVASENLNNNEWSPNNYTGKLPYVDKRKDYFTSALPNPQKGAPVQASTAQFAPIVFDSARYLSDLNNVYGNQPQALANFGFTFAKNGETYPMSLSSTQAIPQFNAVGGLQMYNDGGTNYNPGNGIMPNGAYLQADLSNATFTNINELRFAFQLQRMLERDSLFGSRINEYYLGHFGVTSPDARLQFTEYLGGGRIPISVQQVAQTSQGSEDSPLANVGAFSLSNGKSRYTKGFVEHGYVLTVACIRCLHTYQQGINKMWSRTSRNDFYDPLFATLGEQPIYKSELYALNEESVKGEIFGYNEAWADYRYSPSRVSGQMRSGIDNSLDIWHFADNYAEAPTLSQDFTNETGMFFDRTLSVPSESQDNFICDFWFDTKATRVMPLYSVPGLVDHH